MAGVSTLQPPRLSPASRPSERIQDLVANAVGDPDRRNQLNNFPERPCRPDVDTQRGFSRPRPRPRFRRGECRATAPGTRRQSNGLIVGMCITHAHGRAEVEAAYTLIERNDPTRSRRTVAADKGYDTRDFVEGCRRIGVTPHIAMNTGRSGGSAIDGRTSNTRAI